jgi:hypothetical protein
VARAKKRLARYHDEEAALVLARSQEAISRGFISAPTDMYPDLVEVSQTSYVRRPLPLSFLLLLYERTVVFVPPLGKKALETRWGLSVERFIEFAQAGIIQPIIGHATDYGDPHFDALLDGKPPSLWARGLAIVEALGMMDTLTERGCPLPVAEMAMLPNLRRKYERRYRRIDSDTLTERIKQEILTNYADLAIFGEREFADGLADVGTSTEIMDRLLLANEVRTYPVLFGLGGTANYDTELLREEADTATTLNFPEMHRSAFVIPSSLTLLARGLGIDLGRISAHEVREFHISGDGQRLRRAMEYFEREAHSLTQVPVSTTDPTRLLEVAAELQRQVDTAAKELSAPQFTRTARRIDKTVHASLTIGMPAIGGALSHIAGASVFEGAIGGSVAQQFLKDRTAKALQRTADLSLAARFNPGLANLWRIVARRGK